jgi:hypothetical protein
MLASVVAILSVAIAPSQVAQAVPTDTVTNCSGSVGTLDSLPYWVQNASSGDTINFSVTCPQASPITLTGGPIVIAKDLTITGPDLPADLVVSGAGNSQVFVVDSGYTVGISDITVEDGAANAYCSYFCSSSGGGIQDSGTLTLTETVVSDNTANLGCIAYCGAMGGGIEIEAGGDLGLDYSTVSGNSAGGPYGGCTLSCGDAGGGIENFGTLFLLDSTVAGNNTTSGCGQYCGAPGGGIDNNGSATVLQSTVSGNQADNSCTDSCGPDGGGINNESGATLKVENSTVAENEANTGCIDTCGAFGGGIYNLGSLTVANSTLSGNSVSGSCTTSTPSTCGNAGGGIYNDGSGSIAATIVASSFGSSGGDCDLVTPLTDGGYNLNDDTTCGFSTALNDLPDTDAFLDPALADNGGPTETIALEPFSKAIDHVTATLCPLTDQRGYPRQAPCDIGAYDTDGSPALQGSDVNAVIQVETSPAYADDTVDISSSQLQANCGGTILFQTLQQQSAGPVLANNHIAVVLDDDGNATVTVGGVNCAGGTDVIEADMTSAPYLTALTTLVVNPPVVTPAGVSGAPADEVETGNSPKSGESDVYAVFNVETSPAYAEQTVEISSPQLEDRCGGGWVWEPGNGGTEVNGPSTANTATTILDDDGNATFTFFGVSCAAGASAVTADVQAGTHPTYVTSYTVGAPQVTLAASVKAGPATSGKHKHRPHHKHSAGSGPPSNTAPMTVTASPNPLVETGS